MQISLQKARSPGTTEGGEQIRLGSSFSAWSD